MVRSGDGPGADNRVAARTTRGHHVVGRDIHGDFVVTVVVHIGVSGRTKGGFGIVRFTARIRVERGVLRAGDVERRSHVVGELHNLHEGALVATLILGRVSPLVLSGARAALLHVDDGRRHVAASVCRTVAVCRVGIVLVAGDGHFVAGRDGRRRDVLDRERGGAALAVAAVVRGRERHRDAARVRAASTGDGTSRVIVGDGHIGVTVVRGGRTGEEGGECLRIASSVTLYRSVLRTGDGRLDVVGDRDGLSVGARRTRVAASIRGRGREGPDKGVAAFECGIISRAGVSRLGVTVRHRHARCCITGVAGRGRGFARDSRGGIGGAVRIEVNLCVSRTTDGRSSRCRGVLDGERCSARAFVAAVVLGREGHRRRTCLSAKIAEGGEVVGDRHVTVAVVRGSGAGQEGRKVGLVSSTVALHRHVGTGEYRREVVHHRDGLLASGSGTRVVAVVRGRGRPGPHEAVAALGLVIHGADGQIVDTVLLLRTRSRDLDFQAQGHRGTGYGHVVFEAVRHEGAIATARGAVHVTIGLVKAGLRAIHHDEHLELVEVRTAALHIALAAGVEGDAHSGQAGDVDVGRVEDFVTRAVFVVVEQVRVASVLDQLRNAVGQDHAGRSEGPVVVCRHVWRGIVAEVGGIGRRLVLEVLAVQLFHADLALVTAVDRCTIAVRDGVGHLAVTVVRGRGRGFSGDRRRGVRGAIGIQVNRRVVRAGDDRRARCTVVRDGDVLIAGLHRHIAAVVGHRDLPSPNESEAALSGTVTGIGALAVGVVQHLGEVVVTVVRCGVRRRTCGAFRQVIAARRVGIGTVICRTSDGHRRWRIVRQGNGLTEGGLIVASIHRLVHAVDGSGTAVAAHVRIALDGDGRLAAIVSSHHSVLRRRAIVVTRNRVVGRGTGKVRTQRVLDGERGRRAGAVAALVHCREGHRHRTRSTAAVAQRHAVVASGQLVAAEVDTIVEVPVVITQGLAQLVRSELRAAPAEHLIAEGDDLTQGVTSQRTGGPDQASHGEVGGTVCCIGSIEGHIDLGRQQVRHEGVVPTRGVHRCFSRVRATEREDEVLSTTRTGQVGVHSISGREVEFVSLAATHGHTVREDRGEVGVEVIRTGLAVGGTEASLVVGQEVTGIQCALVVVVPRHSAAVVGGHGPTVVAQPSLELFSIAHAIALYRGRRGGDAHGRSRRVHNGERGGTAGVVVAIVRGSEGHCHRSGCTAFIAQVTVLIIVGDGDVRVTVVRGGCACQEGGQVAGIAHAVTFHNHVCRAGDDRIHLVVDGDELGHRHRLNVHAVVRGGHCEGPGEAVAASATWRLSTILVVDLHIDGVVTVVVHCVRRHAGIVRVRHGHAAGIQRRGVGRRSCHR